MEKTKNEIKEKGLRTESYNERENRKVRKDCQQNQDFFPIKFEKYISLSTNA